jgi:hypothetical protein
VSHPERSSVKVLTYQNNHCLCDGNVSILLGKGLLEAGLCSLVGNLGPVVGPVSGGEGTVVRDGKLGDAPLEQHKPVELGTNGTLGHLCWLCTLCRRSSQSGHLQAGPLEQFAYDRYEP